MDGGPCGTLNVELVAEQVLDYEVSRVGGEDNSLVREVQIRKNILAHVQHKAGGVGMQFRIYLEGVKACLMSQVPGKKTPEHSLSK